MCPTQRRDREGGLRSFTATPRLPASWDRMKLADVHAFGSTFDLEVRREGGKLRVEMSRAGKAAFSELIAPGASVRISTL
jgi:hypothetical protein